MPSDYRYNPFLNVLEPITITGETHVIPTNSPFTIRLAEVPLKESPSTVSLTIGGVTGVEVAADPAAGEFRCDYTTSADQDDNWNTGLIQFNAAEAGKTVVVNYNGMGTLASTDFHGFQMFNAVGTFTFTVPKGVNKVYVSGCGGGGGGGKGTGADAWGSGGGGAQCAFKQALNVIPGATYTITIGAGGAGGTGSQGGNGTAGGASSFGSLLTLNGGGAGLKIGVGGASGGFGGGDGGESAYYYFSGSDYSNYFGGNGGGTIFGAGGNHGSSNNRIGHAGAGYGAGGAGTPGIYSQSSGNGGAGANGFILVEW